MHHWLSRHVSRTSTTTLIHRQLVCFFVEQLGGLNGSLVFIN